MPSRSVSTGMRRLLPLIGLTLVLGGCSSQAVPAGPAGGPSTGIVARGEGIVSGSPDTAAVVLGVQTRAPGARAALDANTARANTLIAVLKERGVADKDLRTSELSINPTYGGDGPGRITGYQVSNEVTATVRDIAAAGGIIDAAAAAAGDAVRVQQLSFSVADDSGLRAEARAAAVRQAQERAKQMAEAAGVSLGPLLSITEAPGVAPPVPYATQSSRAVADVPVQPGTQELRVSVDVVYAIDQ